MLRTAENPILPSFQSNPHTLLPQTTAARLFAPHDRLPRPECAPTGPHLHVAEIFADCSGRMVVSGFLLCAASPPLLFSINSRELQLRVLLIVQFSKPAAEPLTIFLHTGPTPQSFS